MPGYRGPTVESHSSRHLSGAVAPRACFCSSGADSGPSIGRSSLFLSIIAVPGCVPHQHFRGWHLTRRLNVPTFPPNTTPSNSFNYNKQFIRSIRDPPTGIKWRVWHAQNPTENT
ncbi:hypothetical protein KQX54_020044 [Cotesia glomerata]|uniref:Uncharacterized protein n=1 Tax=Cotesia glomerata TaxID=32391 RepID=A0AAV7HXP0_COTGL|nr:hypothetical protein KQX54_020044 [Cotesia glomerata]